MNLYNTFSLLPVNPQLLKYGKGVIYIGNYVTNILQKHLNFVG